ncbi:hypothetical protein GGI35DRAFT_438600 [Trichoderma velutinum]
MFLFCIFFSCSLSACYPRTCNTNRYDYMHGAIWIMQLLTKKPSRVERVTAYMCSALELHNNSTTSRLFPRECGTQSVCLKRNDDDDNSIHTEEEQTKEKKKQTSHLTGNDKGNKSRPSLHHIGILSRACIS